MEGHASAQTKKKKKHKHAPSVIPSNKSVSTFRISPGLKINAKKATRDPRFDPLHSNKDIDVPKFNNKYKHVFELQKAELQQMKKQVKDSKRAANLLQSVNKKKRRKLNSARAAVLTHDAVEDLKQNINKLANQVAVHDQQVLKNKVKSMTRKQELEAIRQGKNPYFQKTRVQREGELVAQFDELKKSGRLDAFMLKKRKQRAAKDRKHLPGSRPGE